MSEVVILIEHKGNGFCRVSVDGKYCGQLEDPDEYTVFGVLKNLVTQMPIENTKVVEKRLRK